VVSRFISALAATMLALPIGPAVAATTLPGPFDDSGASYNLVSNGGMETLTWGGLGSWSILNTTSSVLGQHPSFSYAGAASGGLINSSYTNSGSGVALYQNVWFGAGDYVISAYVYNDLTTGHAYLDLNDGSYLQADGDWGDCQAASTPGEAAWEFVYCQLNVPSGRNIRLRLVLDMTIPASSSALFDEVAVTPAATFTPPASLSLDSDGDGVTIADGDCDDFDASNYPGNTELCDGLDNDCSGAPDADPAGEVDADTDGFLSCDDCDDTSADSYPGAAELCDGFDNDCDGAPDFDAAGEVDADADGSLSCADCDDADPTSAPGAPELCDGLDNDCDGAVPTDESDADTDGLRPCGGDCDDAEPTVYLGAPEACDAVDSDCDGSLVDEFEDTDGDLDPDCTDPDDDGDGEPETTDCDDLDATIYTGAPEVVGDGIDQDCSGADTVECFADLDGDGFGGPTTLEAADGDCIDAGESDVDTDCDDDDPLAYPLAPEIPADGIDQNCDGADSGVACFEDLDGDTFGSAQVIVSVDEDCDDVGESALATDCDDADPAAFPGAPETVDDGIDQDCNGFDTVTCLTDSDGDGFGSGAVLLSPDGDCTDAGEVDPLSGGDCDDTSGSVFPGAAEIPGDGVDQDCSGTDTVSCFIDGDGDGYGDGAVLAPDGDCLDPGEASAGGDCDDASTSVFPGAPETANDGIDQDCDGVDLVLCFVDNDGDTVGADTTVVAVDGDCVDAGESSVDGDCDDTDPAVYPGAPEACDDTDSDCDGDLVDDFADFDGDSEPDCTDPDDDDDGSLDGDDCGPTDAAIFPGATETCDPVDSDCDGDLVDGFDDVNGDNIPDCVAIDGDGDGFDAVDDCDDGEPTVYPGAAEVIDDGVDQDCSGTDSVSCFVDGDGDTYGCSTGLTSVDDDCTDLGESDSASDCDDSDAAVFPGAPEAEDDGVDQDCDGFDTVTCYLDGDGDGAGSAAAILSDDGDCDDLGEAPAPDDCDDTDPAFRPGAPELCDLEDHDCDGDLIDGYPDTDADGQADCVDYDDDDDGYPDTVDCGPTDPTVYPLAQESCDAIDSDCDGDLVDEFDDLDGDGLPDCPGPDPDSDGDGDPDSTDCDDDDPNIYTGAPEIPGDGIDQDCDGLDEQACFADSDGDGHGGAAVESDDCGVEPSTTTLGGDCDDDDPLAWPGFEAGELCDGVDNDCSGQLEPDEADGDEDGWLACAGFLDRALGVLGGGDCDDDDPDAWPGAFETSIAVADLNCDGVFGFDVDGDGWLVEDGDCDDGDAEVSPEAVEICDGRDTDCDGSVDPAELADVDGDGHLACEDCADAVADVHPGAEELCDGRDDDCDGLILPDEADMDGDGVPACAGDCDDEEDDVAAGLAEDCEDGLDNDCDGTVDLDADEDGDGWGTCEGDCDDSDADVNPDMVELCNGVDDDCDGAVDPAFDADGDGWVACPDAEIEAEADCDDDDPTVYPGAPPICDDGVDNDCDPLTLENVDLDHDGYVACPPDDSAGDCWEGNPLVYPTAEELCDWIDNDCDGQIDEFLDADEDGQVSCEGDCNEGVARIFTGAAELCGDGIDEDCDGEVDEDCDAAPPIDPLLMPPGCSGECGATGARPPASACLGLGLLAGLVGLARRRRRQGPGPAVVAAGLLLALALIPRPGHAGTAEAAAMEAYAFQQRYCAEVAGATSTSDATQALSEVTIVLSRLSLTYDETGVPFLLYWRGVLLQCVQQEERAIADMEAFLASPGVEEDFTALVKESRRRIRIMTHGEDDSDAVRPAPTVVIGLGGGYQLTASAEQPFHYGQIGLDVSIKLYKILRLTVFARPGFTGPLRHESGLLAEPRQYTTLVSFGLGPELRWEGPVRPSVSLRLQLAPDDGLHAETKVLPGIAAVGALDIGLGRSVMAIRPMVEVGALGQMFLLRGGVQVVVGL
jgi:hypothetical protein